MGDVVYFVNNGKIVVNCPRCRFSKEIPAAKFLVQKKHVRLRVRCRCGHLHTATVERRRQNRKYTRLEGRYIHLTDKFIHTEGEILVHDLSSQGIGFTFLDEPRIALLPGDPLSVQFRINELPGAFFKKEMLVKSSKGSRVGGRFLKKIDYESDKTLKIFLAS